MKKKIVISSVLTSFFAIGLGVIFSNINNTNSNCEFGEVINEEELFSSTYERKLEPKEALMNDALLEPKIGVQLSSIEDNKRSMRFIGVIQDLNISCSFTRTIYDPYGSSNSGEQEFVITTAYSKIKMGDSYYTPSELGFEDYNYFVTYTLKNIPEASWYYITDVSLDISGNTSLGEVLTANKSSKANVHGAMKNEYSNMYTFDKLDDGTYSMTINDDYKSESSYYIPEYVNIYDGNVASKDGLISAYGDNAFKGCTNLESFTISKNIKSIGENAFKGCSNLSEIYYENDLENWCNVSLSNEFSNPMAYASSFNLLDEFSSYYELNDITIPSSITEIGNYQFYNFKNVKNVVIHEDVISFGEKAFYNFSSLETLYYNETIDTYDRLTFKDSFHSDPSNYAKTFYVLNGSNYEEYEKPSSGSEGTPSNPQYETIDISKSSGHLESAYLEWDFYQNATGYNVYYRLSSSSSWTQIDTELIRKYPSYIRADILGLKAGNYRIKVVPIINNEEYENGASECNAEVITHDRSGYGFVNGITTPGAYNSDGTLKSNAVVLYVTDSNKDSVSITTSKGSTFTGFASIVANWKEKYETRPLCVRLIGDITDPSTGLDKGDLLIDGSTNLGITIEGVGNDATCNGWGIRIKNSSYIEINNLGLLNCNSDEGDSVGLQQSNDHVWVHNNDFFYGDAGSDADQAKGDGALDTKKSTYVTHSYNHFWDTGKTHLNGNGDTVNNYISYHHNWYDHSDSRHPRVRVSSAIHVYNNYFDGVSKYGIGATTGCSIYVEGNYFRSCKYPMLISLQGNDGGTFSGEDGGMIKAYDNYMTGTYTFTPYSSSNTDEFDAYVASSRNETVPSTIKTSSGGNTYSNFDTASDFCDYFYESPEQARETVMNYAGRVEGGDFKWAFTNADDTDYDVNSELKSALTSYKTTLVSVGGGSITGDGGSATVDASEIIARIEALDNVATINNVEEIKKVYNEYLTYDSSLVTNSSKIIRLYNESLEVEEYYFEDLVDIAVNNLSLANLEKASNYYDALSSTQQSNVSEAKATLDELYVKYESIAVDNVISLINALPDSNNVTLSDKDKINEVNTAYEALSSTQKADVTNYAKLQSALEKITQLENQQLADAFIEKVNELPSSTALLQASDLATIETLLNQYNDLSSDVQDLIDDSYITKLNSYKTYIETYLVSEKTVSLTLADVKASEDGKTANGFTFSTNGESGEYIKLKGSNFISYDVETSNIEMTLVACCTDSSSTQAFSVTVTYKDGTSVVYPYYTEEDKNDKTIIETYSGDIVSITINSPENTDKNLGVKSVILTYTASTSSSIDQEVLEFMDLVNTCSSSLTKTNLEAAYSAYDVLDNEQKSLVSDYKLTLDNLQSEYDEAYDVYESIESLPSVNAVTLEDESNVNSALEAYNLLNSSQKEIVTNSDKLTTLINKIAELKENKTSSELFIAKVDALPSSTEELKVDDLATIENLLSEYNAFDDEIKSAIDESYIEKLNTYKTYINDNLIDVDNTGGITVGGVFDDWDKDGSSIKFEDLWNSIQ